MTGSDPGALLRPPPEDALQDWIVLLRVNRAGVGDDDTALIEPERLGVRLTSIRRWEISKDAAESRHFRLNLIWPSRFHTARVRIGHSRTAASRQKRTLDVVVALL